MIMESVLEKILKYYDDDDVPELLWVPLTVLQ